MRAKRARSFSPLPVSGSSPRTCAPRLPSKIRNPRSPSGSDTPHPWPAICDRAALLHWVRQPQQRASSKRKPGQCICSAYISSYRFDGWSVGIFVRELTALYRAFSQGQPSPLPLLPIQYADFAVWQRAWLQGPSAAQQLAYWQKQLVAAPQLLQLPTDFPRPAMQTFQGAAVDFRVPTALHQGFAAVEPATGCHCL